MLTHSDDDRTLPADSDDRKPITVADVDAALASWTARQLAPVGQLVLPAVPAQLGLDGLAYEPRRQPTDLDADSRGRSPEESARPLGTSHGVFDRTSDGRPGHPTDAPFPGLQLSLGLDLDAADNAQQLSLFARQAMHRELFRAPQSCPRKCACHPFDRDAKCNWTRYLSHADAHGARHDSGAWSLKGVIKCGTWTCAACGPAHARATASKLGVAIDRHLASTADGVDADVWMLTLTIPHYADVPADVVVDQLYAATAKLWTSPAWRAFEKRWGLIGRVRVLDATHGGPDGSHPHFHVALFPTRAGLPTVEAFALSEEKIDSWTIDERGGEMGETGVRVLPSQIAGQGVWTSLRHGATPKARARFVDDLKHGLIPAWEKAVRASGARIENPTKFRENSVKVSPSEKASAYFVKWGLADEVGAPTAKARNHLRMLDAAAAGVPGAAHVVRQWRKAVAGHAWVTGLADVCNRLGVTDEDARQRLDEIRAKREAQLAREGTPVEKVPELNVIIRAHVYAVALALGWEQVFGYCDEVSARGGDVQAELDAWLWQQLGAVDPDALAHAQREMNAPPDDMPPDDDPGWTSDV